MTNWDVELWGHQGRRITAGELARRAAEADSELPVRVVIYDGSGTETRWQPVHIGYELSNLEWPDAVVIAPEARVTVLQRLGHRHRGGVRARSAT